MNLVNPTTLAILLEGFAAFQQIQNLLKPDIRKKVKENLIANIANEAKMP